jgi:hypothetical protein
MSHLHHLLKSTRLFIALTFVVLGHAGASPLTATPEGLLSSLSRCDGSFFKAISASAQTLAQQGQLDLRGDVATWAVPNISHPMDSKVFFNVPLRVSGLEVIGYFDEVTPIPSGIVVSWGLLVSGDVSRAAEAVRALLWESPRLRAGDGYFVRSEIWNHSRSFEGWRKEATEPGPPKPGTVERVLMIEPYDGETAYIRIGCSLQGEVSREMMQSLRPDFHLRPQ